MRAILYAAAALAAFIILTNLLVDVGTRRYIYTTVADAPIAQVVLIPGAPLTASGELTPVFVDRVNTAIALYESKKVRKILVSGDNGTVDHNEVNAVLVYLLGKGVPGEDIFLDHAGFDTYSSMYRAKYIFGVSSLIVASQTFHLPRAVFIGRELDLVTYGVSADEGSVLMRNYVREVFANEKAVFDLVVHTQPKYLGETIPITGDGRNYP